MTLALFKKWAEAYYGRYRPIVWREVAAVLDGWTADSLLALREEALREISTQYKTPPDVAFIVKSAAAESRRLEERDDKLRREQLARQRTIDEISDDGPEVVRFNFRKLLKKTKAGIDVSGSTLR